MPFAIGENVGPYRIVERLGQGGMATVFKAYHPALDRYVAIKVLHPAFREDPNFLARFQREARIVAKLDHPNIVPIYDFAEHREHPYLVMRFVEGETLKARLQRGPLSLEEIRQVVEAVGAALIYAHRQGILHRDIKPSNIILTPEGQIYLTDFGLARMAEAGESTLSRDMMVGTPQYISPEQAKGETRLDARTDIYSLGVVIYELLVGRVPFQADTPYAVIHDHIFTPLPLPRSLKPDLSEPLERLLLKALAKDPNDRFQTIEELVAAFRTALESVPAPLPETVVAPVPSAKAPRAELRGKRRRWPWVVAALGAFLCTLFILGFAVRRHQMTVSPGEEGTAEATTLPSPGPLDAERLLEQARLTIEQGQPARAAILYRQAVQADPHLVPAYLEGSDALLGIGKTEEALQFLLEGLAANPDVPELHRRIAEIAAQAEKWDIAKEEVRWLLEETPDNPLAHAYAGLIALETGRPCEEARPELDAALELDPNLAWAHYGLAVCFLRQRDVEATRAELEFVLGQDNLPPTLRARAERQMAILELGVEGVIEQEFQKLGELGLQIPEEGGLRGSFEGLLDQVKQALEAMDKESALQALEDAQLWVKENRSRLGDPLAEELEAHLKRLVSLVAALPGP